MMTNFRQWPLRRLFTGAGLLVLALATGCSSDPKPSPAGPGYATGKVVDTQGRPLPGITVLLDNTAFFNTHLEGTTDANGMYRIRVTRGSWRAIAEYNRPYNGRVYRFDLEPSSMAAFTEEDAVVRDFTWKITGPKSDPPGALHGGWVDVHPDLMSGIQDRENVDFTFKPVGPLVDGSTGTVLTRRVDLTTGTIADLPIGRYRITARYQGRPLKVRSRVDGAYTADGAATLDFYGREGQWSSTNVLFLEYTE
ncbi:carboxypeptidase-like regulatory domain-containing protein [Hymenobacter sp. B81]|uniref:carboxypeptidase-like regulatory domain-containing protein n=1 Tax=Hymenobacter sp. B81 TaxID=3344878 RepID=UPI0037DCA03D